MTNESTTLWNSLEIIKLISNVLTPTAIALLGIYIHRVSRRFEETQWKNQKIIEKRLAIYDDLAPHFNDLLCYFTYIGAWKEMRPSDVIKLKRTMDRKICLAEPLFPKSFSSACHQFQCLCFQTYGGWGKDALLRTGFTHRQGSLPGWQSTDERFFSQPEDATPPQKIEAAYEALMTEFADSFGMTATHTSSSNTPVDDRTADGAAEGTRR